MREFIFVLLAARAGDRHLRFPGRQGCEKPLQYLADFGHELMLIQVWADEDRTPPWEGELELRRGDRRGA